MIYTKTGDQGETSLANGVLISKTDARMEAYGTVDELNSWIGMLRVTVTGYGLPVTDQQLTWLQNKLFNLGAALSLATGEWITDADVHQLEEWIDAMQTEIPRQKAFILPYGSEAVCRCHVCRTVCRRAERKMIVLDPDLTLLRFINRTSDFLFVLSRFISFSENEKEEPWKPN